MKNRKSILAFILAGIIAIGCTACSTNELDSSTEVTENTDSISTAADDVQPSESPQTLGTVELNYTYTSRGGTAVSNIFSSGLDA